MSTATRIGVTFLGVSDEQLACDCCGKSGLKRTVALRFDDEVDAVFYGTSCAARALGMTTTAVTNTARDAQTRADQTVEVNAERRTYYAAALVEFEANKAAGNTVNNPEPNLARARKTYFQLGGFDGLGVNFPTWMAGVAETGVL